MRFKYIIPLLLSVAVACTEDRDMPAPKPVDSGSESGGGSGSGSEIEPTAEKEVIDYDLSVLDKPLTRDMILTSGTWLQNKSVMQSFALKGSYMYADQVAASGTTRRLNVTYKPITSNSGKSLMQLEYYGHGSNIVLEEASDGDYIWIGSYGTQTKVENGNEYYTNNQTVARVKFRETGKTSPILPQDCEDHFYIPGMRNIHPSIDWANRQIAFWCVGETNGYFYVYDLDEVLSVPKSIVTLAYSITRGGTNEAFPKETKTYNAVVHNLSAISPIARLTLASTGVVGNGNNQGFELHAGRIYHYSGSGNNNDRVTPSISMVTVFDFQGKTLARKQVMAVYDMDALEECGITDSGFMESEGIKIYDGTLYLGFATKKLETDGNASYRYVTILKYPLTKI